VSAHPAVAPGRVAVVTGGASGIGFSVAERLGRAGMRVVLADLPGEALDTACDPNAVVALADAAIGFGEVSLLMNNAGREGGGGIFPVTGPAEVHAR